MSEKLITIHVVGQATLTGGLEVRAVGLEPIFRGSNEIATTIEGTEEQYNTALGMLNSGIACFL